MLELGSELPDLEMVDVDGNASDVRDLATTGLPVLVFGSAASGYLRALEPVYNEVAKLDDGDYQVWAIMHGPPAVVRETYRDLAERVRVFPFAADWDGIDKLALDKLPALYVAGQANKIEIAVEGWDRAMWQEAIQDMRALLGWRPTVLGRDLPPSGAVVVNAAQAS